MHAQLGFCSGNSGDPIFTETFGTGNNLGPPLPAGTTTYQFVAGTPQDGQYTISNNSGFFDWHTVGDRTLGDSNGKMLIVNADFSAGEFFRITVSGLCQGTTYEFSAWIINLLPPGGFCANGIPINVGFEIWDSTDTILLATGDTGPVGGTATPVWNQYGLVFQTQAGQTEVILKMRNNGIGGCGNDLAIDDIVFKSCGDTISINDDSNNTTLVDCINTSSNVELTANPDFSVFNTHAYQWQTSTDSNTWNDISGATNQTYTANNTIGTNFYRVKVAEDAANVQNDLCNVISEVFELTIEDQPSAPNSLGDIELCNANDAVLAVEVLANESVNWYDAPSGGNLIQSNSATLTTNVEGIYYAEAKTNLAGCVSVQRTAVTFTRITPPESVNESISFCEGESVTLQLTIPDIVSYNWSTGETTPEITVNSEGLYTVDIETSAGCQVSNSFELIRIEAPSAPISLGDVELCNASDATLQVDVPAGINVNWYDSPTGGTLLQSNNTTYITGIEGTFYAESIADVTSCVSIERTAINFTRITPPESINESISFCEGETVTLQVSIPNIVSYNWSTGETTPEITVNNAGAFTVAIETVDGCQVTNSFEITQFNNPEAPMSLGDVVNCNSEDGILEVEVPNNTIVNWYDAPTGGNLLQENSTMFTATNQGTYYAEAVSIPVGCSSNTRTAVNFSRLDPLDINDEVISFCQGDSVLLQVDIPNNVSYTWSTGETTPEIIVNAEGLYTVDFLNANGCEATKSFEVLLVNEPVISEVVTNGFNIEIFTTESGDYSYSIDGQNFQYDNIFYGILGGRYTITVRDNFGCGQDLVSHLHFVIPKFMTPNNDGFNDFFELRGIEEFGESEINIFDRYGKLLKSSKNAPFSWNGTYRGRFLPTNDYWYQIIIDGEEFTGHFTLKR